LQGANLAYANLQGADLYHADLRNADLRSTDLSRANLEKALFTNTKLMGADLFRSRLADISEALRDRATISHEGY
jgi:uncharacterized protein YjbI with pentapeptide repeats